MPKSKLKGSSCLIVIGTEGLAGGVADFVSVAVSLAVILGLLFLVAYCLRRWRPGRLLRPRDGEARITIITTRGMGWQSSLQIVEVEGQRFLIGASRSGITAIGRLEPPSGDFAGFLEPRASEHARGMADA
jgi:flagellar biogenesis protein FliO